MCSPVTTVWKYMGAMMGGNSYAVYCRHLQENHPEKDIPTEAEFWRERWAEQDRNPGARCC
nr:YbdD/YjiX family protein [Corynebacterium caspium]